MRFYRVLLRLYPASFRHEYGAELAGVFADHRARTRGAWAVLTLWLETTAEVLRDAARVHLDILRQDLRYAARTFAQSPGFVLTAILISALGIGATTAVFSLADHVLLRPLPFPQPDRLMRLLESVPQYEMELSPANYRDWKRMSTCFEGFGAYNGSSSNFVGEGEPERLDEARVTAELFTVLGVQPVLGRQFLPEDDVKGASGTIILSHGLWERKFGAQGSVLGKKVLLDGEPYVIIGVMPRGFNFPTREVQLWRTFRFGPENYEDRNDNFIYGVARLREGVSLEQARSEMNVIAAQLEKQFPEENKETRVAMKPLRDSVSSQSRLLLTALAGASICVLLIACSNLANLLLVRALARRKELAVRAALGAGRERLARQLLTESLLLAFCGGALGVMLAAAALPLLTRLVPTSLPIAEVPALDFRVLGFAAVITLVTGIAFGVAPALRLPAEGHIARLNESARTGASAGKQRLRSALVIAEVTATVVLLAFSGLLMRALWKVQAIEPGFRSEGVMTARTWLPWPKYAQTERRHQFYSRVLEEVRAIPGVSSAGYISFLPMTMTGGIWPVSLDGRPVDRAGNNTASMRFVTSGTFEALRMPLLAGRLVNESDTMQTQMVAVVSESFGKQFFPGQNPLGRTFHFARVERTIVGVVGDVRVRGLERQSEPQVYLPSRQINDGWMIFYPPKDLVVHTSLDPAALAPAIREIVKRADPEQPVSHVRTLEQVLELQTAPRRVQLRVLGAFAGISFLLAAIGMYGLLSFAVSQRQQEIGVRLALGAPRGSIVSLLLRHMFWLAAAGTVGGVALAYAAGRWLSALLAGIAPSDPLVFGSAVALALFMTLLGSVLPTLRAVGIDPVIAMRNE